MLMRVETGSVDEHVMPSLYPSHVLIDDGSFIESTI